MNQEKAELSKSTTTLVDQQIKNVENIIIFPLKKTYKREKRDL